MVFHAAADAGSVNDEASSGRWDTARALVTGAGTSAAKMPGNASAWMVTSTAASPPSTGYVHSFKVADELREREAALQLTEALALFGDVGRDVDEADDVLGGAGDGDDRAAVRVSDEDDRAVDLRGHGGDVRGVGGQSAQRVRRRDHGDALASRLP